MPQDPRTGQRIPNGAGSPLRSNNNAPMSTVSPSNGAGFRRQVNGDSSSFPNPHKANPGSPSRGLELPSVRPVDAEPRRPSQAMAALPDNDKASPGKVRQSSRTFEAGDETDA